MGDATGRAANRAGSDQADAYQEFRYPLLVLGVTTAIAGGVDAFAFLHYGAFVANQSGNAIFLGIGPAGGHPAWPNSAASLVAFAAGTGLVTQLRARRGRWSAPARGLAAALLAMSLWAVLNALLQDGRHSPQFRFLLAASGGLAMGALTTLFVRTAGLSTTITYQSGTVAKTGENIAWWLANRAAATSRTRRAPLLGLLSLLCYALGGAIGTLLESEPRWVPAWGTLALSSVAFLIRPQTR